MRCLGWKQNLNETKFTGCDVGAGVYPFQLLRSTLNLSHLNVGLPGVLEEKIVLSYGGALAQGVEIVLKPGKMHVGNLPEKGTYQQTPAQ